MSVFQPSLADVIRRAVAEGAADIHVSIPAKVVKLDLAKGMLDAKPLVKDVIEPRRGERRAVSVPVITNVPIVWPGAGGMRVTFPMKVGDFVLLVFAERSLDGWLATAGTEVDPIDPRRHAISDAIAIPGLRPFSKAWKGASSSHVTIGSDAGTDHPAGWADRIADALEALKQAVENHQHNLVGVTPGGATITGGAVGAKISTPPTTVTIPDVQSKTVRIRG